VYNYVKLGFPTHLGEEKELGSISHPENMCEGLPTDY
jgi:hypothetical protein